MLDALVPLAFGVFFRFRSLPPLTTPLVLPGPVAEAPAPSSVRGDPDPSGRDRLAWNVLAGWAGYAVEVATGFVLPRMMDHHLGQATLGVWDFAWSCVAYFRFAQVG